MYSHFAAPGTQNLASLWLRIGICLALCMLVAACGFRLKGASPLPFDTLYTNISENSAFGAGLRRAIVASSPHTRFVSDPADAEARLIQLASRQQRRELTIDAEGQVEEYELNYQLVFQLTDAYGRVILPPTELRATREVPYDPDNAQAKQAEIRMIFEDMQQSMVARIVRHLSAPDVVEAFEQLRSEPVPDQLEETLDPIDVPAETTDELTDPWENTLPDTTVPFN